MHIDGITGPAADATPSAEDPLAARPALMSFPHHRAADLTESVLASAAETTRDWRQRVAEWAESPSQPMPGHVSRALEAAFADRILDLELARQVGRPRP